MEWLKVHQLQFQGWRAAVVVAAAGGVDVVATADLVPVVVAAVVVDVNADFVVVVFSRLENMSDIFSMQIYQISLACFLCFHSHLKNKFFQLKLNSLCHKP